MSREKSSSLKPKTRASSSMERQVEGHVRAMKKAHDESWKLIKQYMQGRDIPAWFRGTSHFQGKAANKLNESLLYDLEQRTTHRVRACLIGLGLNPMIRRDDIMFLIKMSRANDLAFLWFLYELHYKTKGQKGKAPNYSINEQLILSAIAHLDMVTTLRELDRILPPPPKKEPPPPPKPRKTEVIRPADVPIHGKIEPVRSPYLQPIRLPKPYSNRNTCARKDFQVTLGEYEVWSDPTHIVQNESNRWFAEYEPKAGRRIVHSILKDEIANIFEEYDETLERSKNPKVLCEGHKRILEMEANLKLELQVIAHEQCLKYFDVESARKERARARIKDQMEKDVEMFLTKFRNIAEKIAPCGERKRESIEILRGEDSFDVEEMGSSEEDEGAAGGGSRRNSRRGSDSRKRRRYSGGCDHNSNGDCESSDEEDEAGNDCMKPHFSLSCFHYSDCDHVGQKQAMSDNVKRILNNSNNKENTNNNNNNNNKKKSKKALRAPEDEATSLTPCSSKIFFVGAQSHRPWRFDYHKVFLLKHPYLEKEDIKEQAAKAIDSEMSFQTKLECLGKPNLDKVITKSVRRTWRRSVRQYNLDNEPDCAQLAAMRAEAEREKVPLDFGRDTFDPTDTKLMHHMLKTAFDYMKQNPKFVLASLPDAYKMPCFLYFIENRYGKRYSLEERHRLYLQSLKILRALEKITKKIPMPQIKQFCTNPFVSYACRDYLLAKAARIKQQYYKELDDAIMRQARVFWFAMRPYLCTSGPPKNTYYAYMPSRSVDITRFRQWKSSEFMNAKGAWDIRQREARKQTFK